MDLAELPIAPANLGLATQIGKWRIDNWTFTIAKLIL